MRHVIPVFLVATLALGACGGDAGTTTTSSPPESTTTLISTTVTEDSSTTTDATTTMTPEPGNPYAFDIEVEGSTVTGGGRISVPVGETVTLRITSDIADEVHIHGYDLFVDLEAGVTAEVSFVADIPGVVEIETHNSQLVIATLEAS